MNRRTLGVLCTVVFATSGLGLSGCKGDRPASPAKPVTDAATAPTVALAKDAAVAPVPISTKGTPPATGDARSGLGPAGPSTVRSTHPTIYLKNLEAHRGAVEKRLADGKDPVGAAELMAAWHIEKMALDGDFAHVVAAEKLIRDALAVPKDPRTLRRLNVRLAGLLTERHAFAEAKALYAAALEADPSDAGAAAGVEKCARNLGEVRADARPATKPSSYSDWTGVAIAEFLGGRIEAADLALRKAHATYPDVHPVPLAWIDLQRGLLRLRTGRYPQARDFFAAAYKRLPQYYVVAEHLAETEALVGNYPRALELYDEVVAATHLPEFMAARAGVLTEMGRHEEAKAQLATADTAWRALLTKHGIAYAAHAVEFFLSDKPDLPYAREWADANLKVRRDPMSLLLAARAHAATGDKVGAKKLIDEASLFPPRTDEFFADLADAYRLIGDAKSAAMAHGQAKALNPKTPPLAP